MFMCRFTIKEFRPGRVLDDHVHDELGCPEPVWPYSTHPQARGRLKEWLKGHGVKIWLPGECRASDDCTIIVRGFAETFDAISENHALCLAVLLTRYLLNYGRHIPIGRRRVPESEFGTGAGQGTQRN